MKTILRKIVILLIGVMLTVIASVEFYRGLTEVEPIYIGPGVTEVKKLSEYFDGIKNTPVDTDVYIMEGREVGATMFLLGGTHPNEPSGTLSTILLIENATLEKGKLILIPHANNSGFTTTHPGEAYPSRYTIKTSEGERWFRFGDRWTNPVHQWPDPEAYTHFPSGQMQSMFDIRNLNRCYPGRSDGTLTEKLAYAITSMIKKENIEISLDMHEAEPMYPIINTIVAHERAMDIAITTSMSLSAYYDIDIGNELSPANLHGLSHREWGDHTDTIALLAETGDPIQDPSRGRTSTELILKGKDEFLLRAAKAGLLFVPYTEAGLPIELRVARHLVTIKEIINSFNEFYPGNEIVVSGIPKYSDVIELGVGYFLKNN